MAGPDCRHLTLAAGTPAGTGQIPPVPGPTVEINALKLSTAEAVFLIKAVYGSSPLLIAISAAINATYSCIASRRAGAPVKDTRYQQTQVRGGPK